MIEAMGCRVSMVADVGVAGWRGAPLAPLLAGRASGNADNFPVLPSMDNILQNHNGLNCERQPFPFQTF